MDAKETIIKALKDVTGVEDVHLETPADESNGDYSSNVAMQMFGRKQETSDKKQTNHKSQITNLQDFNSPRELAEEIVQSLLKDVELHQIVSDVKPAGPGFINFYLKNDYLVKVMQDVLDEKENFGKSEKNSGHRVMVEFAHPNTHKAFHIGHLRNIVTGESVVRLLEATGFEVVRANYQGDVGMHIAKAIYGLTWIFVKDEDFNHKVTEDTIELVNKGVSQMEEKPLAERIEFIGKAYAAGSKLYEENEIAKAAIIKINKVIYKNDIDKAFNMYFDIYKRTRLWSLEYFESIYKRVYSRFDRLFFESETYEPGKKYAEEALQKGIFEESKGAIIFPGSEYGLHDRVFITGEGVPTYEAKDLGLVKLQLSEYGDVEKIIHIVGPEQTEYFKVVFKAQELLFTETKGKQLHVPYGWVRLKDGKMSSRMGNVVLGEMLLDEAKKGIIKRMFRNSSTYADDHKLTEILGKGDKGIVVRGKRPDITLEETKEAEKISVGAVKYSFLKVGRDQDIAFDIKESISLEGNSGPYMQYSVVRAKSILSKAKVGEVDKVVAPEDINEDELSLLRSFPMFSEIVENASNNYSPNLLCNYLYDLAQKFNKFYNSNRILDKSSDPQSIINDPQTIFRLALTASTAQILTNGLGILGIKVPEKM